MRASAAWRTGSVAVVSGETKVEENWRFEIPYASASIFFKFQPKPLLPSFTHGESRGWKPNDAKSVPGFFGNSKPAVFRPFRAAVHSSVPSSPG